MECEKHVPITHNETVEAPFLPEKTNEELVTLSTVNASKTTISTTPVRDDET